MKVPNLPPVWVSPECPQSLPGEVDEQTHPRVATQVRVHPQPQLGARFADRCVQTLQCRLGVTGEARDTNLEAWNRVIDVNLRGVVHGIDAAYPHMIRQGDVWVLPDDQRDLIPLMYSLRATRM